MSNLFSRKTASGKYVMPVMNLDDETDPVIVYFNKRTHQTTLSVAGTIGDRTITVSDTTGIVDGKYLVIFNPDEVRFTAFFVVGAPVGNVVTLDGPLDFAYPVDSFIDLSDTNMNVNGSVTPQVFGIRGTESTPGVELTFKITRIVMECITTSAVSLDKFANITALTNGIQFRTRDGIYFNIVNFKSNADIVGTAYDWTPFIGTQPQDNVDGFAARLTFGGNEKIGVSIPLKIGTDAEWIIQDDLSTGTPDITSLRIKAQGKLE
jgi:hypothetical protein